MSDRKQPKIDISKLSVVRITPKKQSIISDPELGNSNESEAIFSLELTPLFNVDANAIKIELSVVIDLINDKKEFPRVAEFSFDFHYQYENLSGLLNPDGELISDIFFTCSNISYSTLRGIIFAKSSQTCIEHVLLPVVTGAELVKGLVRK